MHPRIYVTGEAKDGLLSLAELRDNICSGHARKLWEDILAQAETDVGAPPITPSTHIPGRSASEARHANRDWFVCNAAGQRLLRAALANLITGEARFRDSALQQMASLFDPKQWPEWRDLAHIGMEADLRTGMLARDAGLAYDWLHVNLTPDQRQWIVEGIDRCGIQPYLRTIDAGIWWTEKQNNWLTCIIGGLGVAGMALGEDHPQSQRLIDYALPKMEAYLSIYGPEGEFNESVAYAGATLLPVYFYRAHRYWTGGRTNRLAQSPFPEAARWYMYFTLPPGRTAAFGDGHAEATPFTSHYAALAQANQDGVAQWYYLNHLEDSPRRIPPVELLWFDAGLEPQSPEGVLLRGDAFQAEGGCVISRTDWDPRSTACVVYGKAGHGDELHGNHDMGQVCIDAYGKRLIVDLGSPPGYPADFFGENRYEYYNAAAWGHNVLVLGGREMRRTKEDRAEIVASEFDDARGGYWVMDLTGMYDGVSKVRRTVVHLLPGIVAVLDEAKLDQPEDISLRWHTVDRAAPDPDGAFTVRNGDVGLSARVLRLDGDELHLTRGQHEYRAPFDRYRIGDPLEQRHESYVEAKLRGNTCRLLSLFSVFGPGEVVNQWKAEEDGWGITTAAGKIEVRVTEEELAAANKTDGRSWRVAPYPGHPARTPGG